VDQPSFSRALSVTPAFEGRLDVRWRGRTAEVRFPEPLQANTTYVFTFDTNLRDVNNVALQQPLTVAFSTGSRIDQGRLAGRAVLARGGAPASGYDVYAYASGGAPPPVLPERPLYRTQTDAEGAFRFEYLGSQPYYVVVLQDRDRNRRPDPAEAYGVPPAPALLPDTARVAEPPRWIITQRDTLPPTPQRVRSLSGRRHVLRFTEPVALTSRDPQAWLVLDSLQRRPAGVEAVYALPEEPQQVYLLTEPLAASPHLVRPTALADTSGNPVAPDTLRFVPGTQPDTLRLRFLGFVPAGAPSETPLPLSPTDSLGVRFNMPVEPDLLQELVAVRDTTGQALAFRTSTPDGTTYLLRPSPSPGPGERVQVTVDGRPLGRPDTVYTRTFEPLPESRLGTLSGTITAPDTTAPVVVELYDVREGNRWRLVRTTRAAQGAFSFALLPEPGGAYRLRAFADRDRDGRWDGGRLAPYRAAGPVTWSNDLAWRARWDTALETPLVIPP
jgi:hypothetical protein